MPFGHDGANSQHGAHAPLMAMTWFNMVEPPLLLCVFMRPPTLHRCDVFALWLTVWTVVHTTLVVVSSNQLIFQLI